jgi:DNA-entry nuclease
LSGGIKTSYRAHWDSQKEYEKFWAQSKDGLQNQKKGRRKFPWILLLILLCVAVIAAVWILRQKSGSGHWPWEDTSARSGSIVDSSPEKIPDYSGDDVIELNRGKPCFSAEDLITITGENYSELDSLGRCGTAVAMLNRTMMPIEQRGAIGNIKPTGWVQEKYPGIVDSEPPYLYNRCHLIAYSMTGQNANEQNLITGTRYMNATTMLAYEEQILRYLDNSDNHVLYRVSPYFKGTELLARGVELEAYSVEDNGKGICFHVFLYNVQPGIEIDYKTGRSWTK